MTRKKFTPAFKTKVVVEALKERESLSELARKYELHPQQIGTWKREFLAGAEQVFSSGEKSKKAEAEEKSDRRCGRKAAEDHWTAKGRDFLKKALSLSL